MPYYAYYDEYFNKDKVNSRRKSKPKNVARPLPDQRIPAAEVVPVTAGQPRPRSSWYSQLTPSEEKLMPQMPPIPIAYAPSTKPLSTPSSTPLTSTALKSLNESSRQGSQNSWEDDQPESPLGTRDNPFMSERKHTAVSEYLNNRSWAAKATAPEPQSPQRATRYAMPTGKPQPLPTPIDNQSSSPFPRFSLRSNSSTSRRRSSLAFLPRAVYTPPSQSSSETSLGLGQQPQRRRASSVLFSSPLSMIKNKFANTPPTPSEDELVTPVSAGETISVAFNPNTFGTPGTTAVPYEQMYQGPAPNAIDFLNAPAHQSKHQKQSPAKLAVARGLSQKYRPAQKAMPSSEKPNIAHQSAPPPTHPQPNHFRTIPLSTRPLTATPAPSTAPPPSYRSQIVSGKPRSTRYSPKQSYIQTATRNPQEHSDQGLWLSIGTLRGPTPSGVREIDEIMARARTPDKKGRVDPEKGLKEVRKILKHENRFVIEWVEDYLGRRWGVQL